MNFSLEYINLEQVNKSITSEVKKMQFLKISNEKNPSIGEVLRFWRKLKRISQMDLALDVGVSTKHLSFVETGRSKPSHNLVLKIAQALKLPLRHRNSFLKAAGYAAMFSE